MQVSDHDPVTGYEKTGHEWDGISELNTPIPRIVLACLLLTTLFAAGYWILMPSWPLGTTYFKGLLGANDRLDVSAAVAAGQKSRLTVSQVLAGRDLDEAARDPAVMAAIAPIGARLFGDNCMPCHGAQARGGKGFPDLTTASRLWGGDVATLAETIRVGINSGHPEARSSQMPAFGRDQMLARPQIERLARHVAGLSTNPAGSDPEAAALFEANCASCHGADARGSHDMGAPDLTDRSWIYGGDVQTVFQTIWSGRQGVMPGWEARLAEDERRALALYIAHLAERRP